MPVSSYAGIIYDFSWTKQGAKNGCSWTMPQSKWVTKKVSKNTYPLAAQQFLLKYGEKLKFEVTQVFGLTNDDAVSKEFRPLKQIVERLNRTFKQTYRISCGYHNFNGASNNVALWVAYYNFLRPHAARCYQVLNKVDEIESAENMPAKWQVLILLGQKKILELQEQQHKVILS
jgi:hypothetical protein